MGDKSSERSLDTTWNQILEFEGRQKKQRDLWTPPRFSRLKQNQREAILSLSFGQAEIEPG